MVPPAEVVTALRLGIDASATEVAVEAEALRARLAEMLRFERGAVAVLLEFMADPDTWADELRDVINGSGVWRSTAIETLTYGVMMTQHAVDRSTSRPPPPVT